MRRINPFIIVIALALLSSPVRSALGKTDYEKPPVHQAKSILKPDILKGKYHTVRDQIKNDGIFNHYTVESSFGTFQVSSTIALEILIHEIGAIAAMKKVETDDTAVASLKKSGENTVAGIKKLVSQPKTTLEGAAAGVSSLFNRAKETVGKRKVADAEDSRFEQLIGLSKSKGLIATKYGVNVYSRNEKLQEELDRLAQADYLGGLGVGVATSFVPGVGGLVLSASGTARLLNEAINTTPASELWLQNKNKLLAMGSDSDTVELFLNNPVFSPAQETVLVTALESLKGVANRELFLKVALQASDPDMAKTITETAVMSAGYHKHIKPLQRFTPMARLTSAVRKDGSVVVLLPTDYIIWSEKVADVAASLTEKAKQTKGPGVEVWTLGSFSERAKSELQKMGWKIYTDVRSQLIPKK
ncbi:MAG: hypothetical protein GY774_24535 [Planctomycetes bacterium]|nr:hypothetical protein [Planctomycetota bacterium]